MFWWILYWLPEVWCPGEISTQILTNNSPGYDTLGRLTLRSMTPWGDWLCPEYDTPGRKKKIQMTQQNLTQNWKYFKPLLIGRGWFKWWEKKTVGRKSCWTVPLTKAEAGEHSTTKWNNTFWSCYWISAKILVYHTDGRWGQIALVILHSKSKLKIPWNWN